jgi:hypothetical protein
MSTRKRQPNSSAASRDPAAEDRYRRLERQRLDEERAEALEDEAALRREPRRAIPWPALMAALVAGSLLTALVNSLFQPPRRPLPGDNGGMSRRPAQRAYREDAADDPEPEVDPEEPQLVGLADADPPRDPSESSAATEGTATAAEPEVFEPVPGLPQPARNGIGP